MVDRSKKLSEIPEIIPSDPDRPARMSEMSLFLRPGGKGRLEFNPELEGKDFVPSREIAVRELMGIFGLTRGKAREIVDRLKARSRLRRAKDGD